MTDSRAVPLMPAPAPRGWWGRHWKWALPAGCMSLVVVCVAVLLTGLFVALGRVRSSQPYVNAMARVRASKEVTDAIGTPVKEDLLITGHFNMTSTSAYANFAIPVTGPKGKATVYVAASMTTSGWTFKSLCVVVTDTQERIDLLAPGT